MVRAGTQYADKLPPCPRPPGASRWSPWAAPATRSTPRSWPAGSRPTAGSWSTTPRTPTWRSSTPAGSSRRRRRTPSTPCSRPPTSRTAAARRRWWPSGCLAERYGDELAEALPEADAVLGFDDYADIAARLRTILAGGTPRPARAARPPARCCRSRRSSGPAVAGPRPRRARRSPDLPDGVAPASGPRACGWPPDRSAAAQAGVRAATGAAPSAPSPPSAARSSPGARRRARRGALAGRAGRPRARAGQRELHVVRQGPRRPAAARDAAARAGRGRRASTGSG